jgi:outer membrane cobalamin receptor
MSALRLLPALLALLLLAPSQLLAAPDDLAPESEGADPVPESTVSETTITATRTRRSLLSLSGTAEVMDRDELDLMDALSLDEAMDQVAGVDVVGDSRYGQEVRFNTRGVNSGFGTQRTLILLDGRPLTDEYLGTVDLAQYPLVAMQRVELVKGPASALYGSNALGGVANLIPRRGGAGHHTEAFVEGGSFGSWRTNLTHGTMIGPVDFFLGVEASSTQGYLDNSRGDDMDWSTAAGFLNLGYEEEDYEVRGYFSLFGGEGTDEDYDRDIARNLQDLLFSYHVDKAKEADLSLRLYRSQLDQELMWFDRPESQFDQVSLGAILTQTYRVHEQHLLLGGLEWRHEQAESDEAVGSVDEQAATWSAFVQDEFQVTPDLYLVLGVRYDQRTNVDGEFSWRVGANWQVVEGTNLRGALGRAFRAPTISDQYLPTTQYFGLTFEGNPALTPEYLHSAEVGVDQVLLPGTVLSVTGFASNFEDFWDFLMQQDGVFRPQNVGKVRILGLESVVTAEIGYGFIADTSYTLTDAAYRQFDQDPQVEGNRLDDNVKHRGSAGVTWRHPDGHAVRLGVLISGDRYTDPENTQAGHLESFVVANLEGVARLTKNIDLTLNVQNLTNTRYYVRPEFKQPGRAIFAGVRVNF